MITQWGRFKGNDVMLFRITNNNGSYVELTNYAATLVSVFVPDKFNKLDNVVLSYPDLEGYLNDKCYIGSTVGRFANRIDKAQFVLDGTTYQLDKNDGNNTNHGGLAGFHARVFDYTTFGSKLTFTLLSKDGDGGYPGDLILNVDYEWNDNNELSICYTASTNKKTVANFTNHAYFNLGARGKDIFDHQLSIDSNKVLETTSEHIPTGKIIPVDGTRLKPGINTYYLFNKENALCRLSDINSGRVLEVATSYPGVQVYTGDFLIPHKPCEGVCLECQYFPDSPNHAHFPSTVLEPGKIYNEYIVYKFSVNEN